MTRPAALTLKGFFFLSGATGLVYEIVWMRQLILVFGSTTYAVSAVLSAFMLGLALGSFMFGRAADRGRRLVGLYGLLEIGVGLYALIAPMLLQSGAPRLVRALGLDPTNSAASVFVRFLLALGVLLPPTILMGGTLPILSRVFSVPGEDPSRPVGRLYALNTFGAVIGTFMAGFVLLPMLGARRSTLLTASINIGLGLMAVILSRAWAGRKQIDPMSSMDEERMGRAATARHGLPTAATPRGGGTGPAPGSSTSRAAGSAGPGGDSSAAFASPSRAQEASTPGPDPGPHAYPGSLPRSALGPRLGWVLPLFAMTGFVAMIYEVAWSRVVSLTIGSSVYGFTMMLLAFLVGLSSGAAVFSRLSGGTSGSSGTDHGRPPSRETPERTARLLAWVLGAVGLASWGTSLVFEYLPFWFSRLYRMTGGAPVTMLAGEFALCLMIMLPATFFMGGVFPLVLRLHARSRRALATRVGEAYAANTAGTVIGSAVAGLLLVPHLGIRTSLILASAISLALGAGVLAWTFRAGFLRWSALAAAPVAIACFVLFTPAWDPLMMNSGVYYDPDVIADQTSQASFRDYLRSEDQVLFYREGPTASVLVGQDTKENNIYVKVNGKTDASTGFDMPTQVFLGQIPLLLHPDPKKVLVIGLGSGVSVGAVATHDVDSIEVVEVEPAMVEAASYFKDYNHDVLSDPRVHVQVGDARNTLLLEDRMYDVIVSEPSNPWMTVASNLFTRDFFTLAKSRLSHEGIYCQWFQVYSLSPQDLRSLLATFRSVFPHALVFWVGESTDLVAIGSDAPIPLDYTKLSTRASELKVAMDLSRVGLYKVEDFLPFLYLTTEGLAAYAGDAPLNTDDNARIEFSSPLSLYADSISENEKAFARHRVRIQDLLTGLPEDPAIRRDFYLDLAQALLRADRPKAALDAVQSADAFGSTPRGEKIRSAAQERLRKS